MGPNFWRHPIGGLKKCSERTRGACTDHDDCCAVTACTYCLRFEVYGEADQFGTAEQSGDQWYGTIAGAAFHAYWQRDYETNVCEFIVTLDDVEVYRRSCYEGPSCRDSSDSAIATIGYDEGTLFWDRNEPVALPHVTDYETGCRKWFCGVCECSCDCLCVDIFDSYGASVATGEICNVSYSCDGPVWEGTVGDYVLSFVLGRDSYDNCIITPTVDGVTQDIVEANGCAAMTATIVTADGTTIEVRCKVCTCDDEWLCCPGRATPAVIHMTLTTISQVCGCLDGVVIPMQFNGVTGGLVSYQAIWQWPCTDLFFPENVRWFKFDTSCSVGDVFPTILCRSLVQLDTDPPPEQGDGRWGTIYVYYVTGGQCDPFQFHYTGVPDGNGVWVRCQDDFQDSPEVEIEITL